MAVKTLPDIIGAGATVPITANRSLISRGWVQFTVLGLDARIGGATTAAAEGAPISDHAAMFLPSANQAGADAYVLADLYAYLPVGSTLCTLYQE